MGSSGRVELSTRHPRLAISRIAHCRQLMFALVRPAAAWAR